MMNKYRNRIAKLSTQTVTACPKAQSLIYLALADSLGPLFGDFCHTYDLKTSRKKFDGAIVDLWNWWFDSVSVGAVQFDALPYLETLENIAPSLEQYTDRKACYAQDACILAHMAFASMNLLAKDGPAIHYFFEPFEEVLLHESGEMKIMPDETWEDRVLLQDPRVKRGFKFVEYCIITASRIPFQGGLSKISDFRQHVAEGRLSVAQLRRS